ncbi:MAG: PIN domain-containing protein [Kiritimatiellae bacterium]|nr:PIN domain-containing protein [Kiritimatiellia bacterium]
MRYLLDTNACIYLIKKSPVSVFKRFSKLHVGDIGISAITLCELQSGVSNSCKPEQNQSALNEFLGPIEILDFPSSASILYGRIRYHLQKSGTPIGHYDLLIASHCLFEGLTLVTNNAKEFPRVPDLEYENWVEQNKDSFQKKGKI